MKIIRILILCLFTISAFAFLTPKINSNQKNYWPTIKGKWGFSNEYSKEFITVFHRYGNPRLGMNFITSDSCFFPNANRHVTGKGVSFINYRWKAVNDTITFISKKDTFIVKLLYLTNEELRFKPIYPIVK
jgi:hypothetical protein